MIASQRILYTFQFLAYLAIGLYCFLRDWGIWGPLIWAAENLQRLQKAFDEDSLPSNPLISKNGIAANPVFAQALHCAVAAMLHAKVLQEGNAKKLYVSSNREIEDIHL